MAKCKYHHSWRPSKAPESDSDMNIRMEHQARLLSSELSVLRAQLLESLHTLDEALQKVQCLERLSSLPPRQDSRNEIERFCRQLGLRKVGRMTEHGIVLFEDSPDCASCQSVVSRL